MRAAFLFVDNCSIEATQCCPKAHGFPSLHSGQYILVEFCQYRLNLRLRGVEDLDALPTPHTIHPFVQVGRTPESTDEHNGLIKQKLSKGVATGISEMVLYLY